MFVVTIISVTELNAQATPCTPDCPGNTWTNLAKIIPAPGFPGCNLLVFYSIRTACTFAHRDIQITGVSAMAGSACALYLTFVAGLIAAANGQMESYTKQLHNYIEQALLDVEFDRWYNDTTVSQSDKDEAMCDPNRPEHGVERWRIIRGSCKIADYYCDNHGVTQIKWVSCPGSACCLKKLIVCYDPVTKHVTIISSSNVNPSILTSKCDTTLPSNLTRPPLENEACFYVCDDEVPKAKKKDIEIGEINNKAKSIDDLANSNIVSTKPVTNTNNK